MNFNYLKLAILGCSSGINFILISFIFPFYFYQTTQNKVIVSFIFLLSLPYAFKLLWGPLLDNLFTRKIWMIILNLILLISNLCLVYFDIKNNIKIGYCIIGCISLIAAIIDTNLDAFRIEQFKSKDLIIASNYSFSGFRIGMFIGGTGLLYLSNFLTWNQTYLSLLIINIIVLGVIFTIKGNPYKQNIIKQHYISIFVNIFKNKELDFKSIIPTMILYKMPETVPMALGALFFSDIGISTIDIATFSRGIGLLVMLLGGLISTYYLLRFNFNNVFLFTLLTKIFVPIIFCILAYYQDFYIFIIALIIQNLCSGLGGMTLKIYMTNLCTEKNNIATTFGILGSLGSLIRIGVTGLCTWLVSYIEWSTLFGILTALSFILPVTLILKRNKGILK